MDSYYVGTDLKFLISIEAQGFSMDLDDYKIVLRCKNVQKTVTKNDIVVDDQNNHYLCVDSTQFGPGMLQMVVYAYVPDEDFPDNDRAEVAVLNLCEIKKV
jgi:hypothetical protein